MSLRYRLRVADREFVAEVLRRDGSSTLFEVQGRRYEVTLEGVTAAPQPALSVPLNPAPAAALPSHDSGLVQPAGGTKVPASDSEHVRAPMPGIVVQVLVSLGQSVTPGDPLLVLEAMKMENSVLAQRSGVVQEILVSKGMEVQRAQVLLRIG